MNQIDRKEQSQDYVEGSGPAEPVEDPQNRFAVMAAIFGRSLGQGMMQFNPQLARIVNAADSGTQDIYRNRYQTDQLMRQPFADLMDKRMGEIQTRPQIGMLKKGITPRR